MLKHFFYTIPRRFMYRWAALVALFALLTAGVVYSQNFLTTFDLSMESLLLGLRSPTLVSIFSSLTHLGDTYVIVGFTAVAVFLLWYRRHNVYALGLFVTVVGAALSDYVLKHLINRARPDAFIPTSFDASSSFPSWHATASVAFYGFVAYVLCRLFPTHARGVTVGAIALTLLIGFSRLYLGLHFPSDVLSGYILGAFWLLIGIEAVRRVQR